ncbi:MAG: Ig-like domain-containing protein, partial [Gemmatimonadota bacterium]|nr:Ig-like domain-containing protein [Gemmatimonadota bacterium]
MQPSNLPSRHAAVSSSGFPLIRVVLLSGPVTLGLTACDAIDKSVLEPSGLTEIDLSKASANKSITVAPRETLLMALDDEVQLSATVIGANGKPVSNPSVNWVSLSPEVATVDKSGRVTAVGVGEAKITGSSQGGTDTATVTVKQVVTQVWITPSSSTLEKGDSQQLTATAFDANENEVPMVSFTWRSEDEGVATVGETTGSVKAVGYGEVEIIAEPVDAGASGTSLITVTDKKSPPPPSEWNRVLADTTVVGDVVVPDGEAWLIGANVKVQGNVRTVNGIVALRPGSKLTFVGGDPTRYVGGGMHYNDSFANDFGLWIGGMGATGRLDIGCTPKRGWNRTGSDATWSGSDEYYIAPTAVGDYAVRRWYPNQPIPQADPRVPAAAVANVTRDCSITGPGHIHIHSTAPQRIEYVRLEAMGVTIPGKEDSGRYAIHLHMMGDGARGTVIRGVAAVNSRGRVYVPHGSHGAVMEDNVSVSPWAQSLWWDHNNAGDRTHDLTVQGLLVLGTFMPRDISTEIKPQAIILGSGDRNVMRGSVVAGVSYYEHGRAFTWHANGDDFGPDVWTLEDNLAHNNRGIGLRLYNTKTLPHIIERFTAYRNGQSGIESGGYASANRYIDILLVGNRLAHHSNS